MVIFKQTTLEDGHSGHHGYRVVSPVVRAPRCDIVAASQAAQNVLVITTSRGSVLRFLGAQVCLQKLVMYFALIFITETGASSQNLKALLLSLKNALCCLWKKVRSSACFYVCVKST